MTDKPETKELVDLFESFDAESAEFSKVACLKCPHGCSDCCDHADTEATAVEAALIASYLLTDDRLAERFSRSLSDPDRVACVFFNPDNPMHCLVYAVRPLICRAFGYSSYSDKRGNSLFALCRSMPQASGVGSGGAMPVLFEPYPPSLTAYVAKVRKIALAETGSASKRPLGEAVLASIEAQRKKQAPASG